MTINTSEIADLSAADEAIPFDAAKALNPEMIATNPSIAAHGSSRPKHDNATLITASAAQRGAGWGWIHGVPA